ncbi:MAG: hypothetical protein ABIM19_03080 [candidate division WOR-3 bacterium]
MDSSEWDTSALWDISDTCGHDGAPDPPWSCVAYAVHNFKNLYLAMRAFRDTSMDDSCEVFFGVDDDLSCSWPLSDTVEGLNRISNQGIWLTRWCLQDSLSPWYDAGLSDFAFSCCRGYITLEWKIPLLNQCYDPPDPSDIGPQYVFVCVTMGCVGDEIGGFLSYYDQSRGFLGWWPRDAIAEDMPGYYG